MKYHCAGGRGLSSAPNSSSGKFYIQTVYIPSSCGDMKAKSENVTTNRYLVTLHLSPGENTLQHVKQLPGLNEVKIDEDYGLIAISPKRNLYTIRVSGEIDANRLMSLQPKVKGIFADVKIVPVK